MVEQGSRMLLVNRVIISAVLIVLSTWTMSDELKPFTTDGCSAFPDGTLEENELWLACCTAHDNAYWKGGTYNDRQKADGELQVCVEGVGEPEISLLMLAGVRVGGSPFFPTIFRWGYGWSYPRLYGTLSDEELNLVIQRSKNEN